MKLVVLGREGVDVIEMWVRKYYEKVLNHQTPE
jgi:hypothetical protein